MNKNIYSGTSGALTDHILSILEVMLQGSDGPIGYFELLCQRPEGFRHP